MADPNWPMVWRRSGRCSNGACVEVAVAGNRVHLRDSKDPDGPRLTFTAEEWRGFVADVRADRFGATPRG
jgi:hypothetical protein